MYIYGHIELGNVTDVDVHYIFVLHTNASASHVVNFRHVKCICYDKNTYKLLSYVANACFNTWMLKWQGHPFSFGQDIYFLVPSSAHVITSFRSPSLATYLSRTVMFSVCYVPFLYAKTL